MSMPLTCARVVNVSKQAMLARLESMLNTRTSLLMVREGWTLKKDLTTKMTSTVMDKLPEPVVILKEVGEGGKVVQGTFILSPKEKRGLYGDLLDKYSSASRVERAKKVRRV